MRLSAKGRPAAALVLAGLLGGLVYGLTARSEPQGQPPAAASPDEAAVYRAMEAFVNAFNANDAKALAATVSPTFEFVDDDSNRVEGAKVFEDLMAKYFEGNKGVKLQFTPEGIRTVAPGVALEDGESAITNPVRETVSVRRVSVVYAKVDGAWKVASIREYPEEPEVVTAEERLKELGWFVGEWMDEGSDAIVLNSVKWSADKSHLVREFSVVHAGQEVIRGQQRIAVDPLSGTVKGWAFDSDGGYGESVWARSGDEWIVRASGVTSDGDVSGATYVIKPLGKDKIELKTMHKIVGETVEADTTTVMVRRVALPGR
jgi:uncharacterized protein (TIGR02246 family)